MTSNFAEIHFACLNVHHIAVSDGQPLLQEPRHDKTNKMSVRPAKIQSQPGHPPSLISVFAVRSMGSLGPKGSSCVQRRL